jgi:PIF1-like helicase
VWRTNKLQSQAVIQPFEFLQRYRTTGYEKEDYRYFEYVGGAGGTGKSRVIDAIYDVFKVKGCEKELLITASSGSAGAKTQGVTIYSALGIGINDKKYPGTTAASMDNQMQQKSGITEKHLKTAELWASRAMLIIDEISMISGALLNEIDLKCRCLGDKNRLFGGIPVVLFSGDFPPVGGLSLLRIDNKPTAAKAKGQNLQNHLRGYNIPKVHKCCHSSETSPRRQLSNSTRIS